MAPVRVRSARYLQDARRRETEGGRGDRGALLTGISIARLPGDQCRGASPNRLQGAMGPCRRFAGSRGGPDSRRGLSLLHACFNGGCSIYCSDMLCREEHPKKNQMQKQRTYIPSPPPCEWAWFTSVYRHAQHFRNANLIQPVGTAACRRHRPIVLGCIGMGQHESNLYHRILQGLSDRTRFQA